MNFMRSHFLCGVLAGSLPLGSLAHTLLAQTDARPLAAQPFHGLLVRDDDATGGLLVGWILPGPLNGHGFTSDVVNRGDLILTVNGEQMDRKQFDALMLSVRPGNHLALHVRHTGGDAETAVPTAGVSSSEKDYDIVLGSREQWAGPIAHMGSPPPPFDPELVVPVAADHAVLERFVQTNVQANRLAEPIDALYEYFRTTVESNNGTHMLSRVRYGFHRPTRLAELQSTITKPLDAVPAQPSLILAQGAANIDAFAPALADSVNLSSPTDAIAEVRAAIEQAQSHLDLAFVNLDSQSQAALPATLVDLTETVATDLYIHGHPDAKRLIDGLRSSLAVDFNALLQAGGDLAGFMEPGAAAPVETPAVDVPESLGPYVTGDVLAFDQVGDQWIVFGGAGPNTYDMTHLSAVIDAGGDDMYRYPQPAQPGVQLIVDFAGNDQYLGEQGGPASAMMGVSLIVDQAGNDRYDGASRSCGVGVMGVGIILDRAGADTYHGTRWSLGTAFYGLGAIIDCGGDPDTYIAELMSEAVGGPRGFGAIIDENGRDLYRVNGPAPSAYGMPAVFVGFSQGVGVGVRLYETGGIGVISDLGGDDRYEGGEFCQGGGYFWALGILHDRGGNDLYYGNRYGQAWAAHQALGILVDDAGDDTYWSMTAASQSGSWDTSATLLLDRSGNDSYQADGLAQGGASQQAIAWFVDLEGVDRYVSPPGATRGQSGGNEYHFAQTGCYSWSLFLDAGGSEDFYSSERVNGTTESTGAPAHENLQNSPLHGLFIDTPEPVKFLDGR